MKKRSVFLVFGLGGTSIVTAKIYGIMVTDELVEQKDPMVRSLANPD
jgi:hypothetical protein